MKLTTRLLLGSAFTAAILIVVFGDSANTGLRFIAKLAILATVLAVPTSVLVTRFFGRDSNRKLWSTLALLGISLAVTLLGAEFVVRIAFRDIGTTADNSSYFARRWYSVHPPARNSMGFREREISTAKPPDTYRIAIIGDSFAYGQGILEEERFSNLLQDDLNSSPGRYEVLNFGRPGAETDDHHRILDEVVLPLSPDFVLLQWFVNDVVILKSGRPTAIRLIPSDFAHAWLHAHSALYYLIHRQWLSLQGKLGLTEQHVDNMTRRFEDPDSEESLAASVAFEHLIWRLKEQGIPAGMVLFPMMVNVDGDSDAYPLGFLMDRVLAICQARAFPCLDLRRVFAGTLSNSNLWVNRLDHHPGAAANERASEAILARFSSAWRVH